MHHDQEGYAPLNKVATPPLEPLQIIYPQKDWYIEGRDPEAHARILRLDRGFYMFKDWWKGKGVSLSDPIEEHSQYCLYGFSELEELIRELHHRIAPKQHIEGKELVFGIGAMNLLNASLYATCIYHSIRAHKSSVPLVPLLDRVGSFWVDIDPLYVTQQLPAYLELKHSLHTGLAHLAKWVDFSLCHTVPAEKLVEYVTSLNNPDGEERTQASPARYVIHDRVNHMPMYYNVTPSRYAAISLANEWISIFSLSKFLGFSGSRVGYAFVQDAEIARYMRYYITSQTHGVSSDGQLRCITALKYLLQESLLDSFVTWYLQRLQKRWQQLRAALKDPKMLLLNNQAASAWIDIKAENAEKYLREKYHIIATYGPEYGVEEEYARFNLIGTQNEFDELLYRLSHGV